MVVFRPEPIPFDQWFEIVERQRAFAQPVYADSGYDGWPLFPIGTGFFIQFGAAIFFCLCQHQVKLAEGRDIVVVHRHGSNFFPVTKMRKRTFENSELVLFGVLKPETMLLPTVQVNDIIEWGHHMAAVGAIGYPRASESFDPEKRTMRLPRDAGLMANELAMTRSGQSWRLANAEKWAAITDWGDLTNGFSGGPALAVVRVSKPGEPPCYETRLIGMTHAATSNPRELHVVPIWEIAARVMSILKPEGGWPPEQEAFLERAAAFFDRGVLSQ